MSDQGEKFDRREFLLLSSVASIGLAMPLPISAFGKDAPKPASPFPLESVRLKPSPFLNAVNANLAYLKKLEPDRLLHNYRERAGLKPKGEAYGGWEADTIAGHTLGHYLTALSLMYAQTGDAECKRRADYIVDELTACQNSAGDGYVAGFTRRKDGKIEDGRAIFPELARGEIRAAGFDLNGCWVPFYNWHKLYSGLFEAQTHCGNEKALKVATKLGGFIDAVFAKFNDDQLQQVLNCEHGGIAESMAELYSRTNDQRFLTLAIRIRHHKTLDPMYEQRDALAHLHANTQIPKVIGLARIYELTNKPEFATAARFFWQTVTTKYSYVIGGNADRESFQTPNSISKYITEQTCESCNTYNMLKLTRHLYAWDPQSSYFDYYERAHFNHILAQENPRTGMFAYMVPLMSGTAREFSSPFNDFWCCVGSGMESHSKHGDSIYWKTDDTLFVNLFIPSTLDWKEQNARFDLATGYPVDGKISIRVISAGEKAKFAVALRVPSWANRPTLAVNGKRMPVVKQNGYAVLRRRWKTGDIVSLTLPMEPRIEPTPDDPKVIALLRGPLVLAANLGPSNRPLEVEAPALVGADVLDSLTPISAPASFVSKGIGRPQDLYLEPFYSQWESRSAVYFPRYTDAEWEQHLAAVAAEEARLKDLRSRSTDMMELGDRKAELAHSLTSAISYPLSYRGKSGRDARSGGYFEFKMNVTDAAPLTLRATYWGEESKRLFYISIDGIRIASETLGYDKLGEFIERDYPIPTDLTKGKSFVTVRFEPDPGKTAGPVFGCLIFR